MKEDFYYPVMANDDDDNYDNVKNGFRVAMWEEITGGRVQEQDEYVCTTGHSPRAAPWHAAEHCLLRQQNGHSSQG